MVIQQIATTPSDEIFALLEDGTLWRYGWPNPYYREDPEIGAVALPREWSRVETPKW